MRKKVIKEISLILIASLIFSAMAVVVLNINFKKEKIEDEVSEINEIIVGDESILYVDLTKNPDNYAKVIEEKQDANIQTNDDTNNNEQQVNNGESSNEDTENQYASKTIMLKTANIADIENYGNAQSIVKIAKDLYCINYKTSQDTENGYNTLEQNEEIQVFKDEKISLLENENIDTVQALEIPADKSNWGTYTTGLSYYVKKLNTSKNLNTIKIAVVDSGILSTHEAFTNETLADRLDLTDSYNYFDNNSDITDNVGHGTKVAGVIAGATSNNIKIVPVKVINSTDGYVSTILTGISAIKDKVDIINLSLGSNSISEGSKIALEEVLKEVYNSGKIVVAASGNSGTEGVHYPASSQYTIAVSAVGVYTETSQITSLADYSNYGDKVEFSAPGSGITVPSNTGNTQYVQESGTSFSAPLVASSFALLKSEYPEYTLQELKTKLQEYCYDAGSVGKDKYFGYGVLDFYDTMFSKPVVSSVVIQNEWAKTNKITLSAICANKITEVRLLNF